MNTQLKTLAKKRTANFREDETRLLIQLWGSPSIQKRLNLTHRKAPVMRLLAANMQQRGFYRSPDEIKTRIRNLKCLYHRIKRTITSGSGIGTVDPDWPHFQAMDAILGNSTTTQGVKTETNVVKDIPRKKESESHVEIKQEIDIDMNDDLASWNEDSLGSEYDDNLSGVSMPEPAITLTTAPTPPHTTQQSISPSKPMQKTVVNIPQTAQPIRSAAPLTVNGMTSSIPLPFLILNNLKPGVQQTIQANGQIQNKNIREGFSDEAGLTSVLGQLLGVQREQLDIEKQRLELEKQRLEFERLVGSQLMTLVPMMGSLVQKIVFPQNHNELNKNMSYGGDDPEQDSQPENPSTTDNDRIAEQEDELEKNRNILRNLLNQGLKARMNNLTQIEDLDEPDDEINKDENDEHRREDDEELDKEPRENNKSDDRDDDCMSVLLINENSNESEH